MEPNIHSISMLNSRWKNLRCMKAYVKSSQMWPCATWCGFRAKVSRTPSTAEPCPVIPSSKVSKKTAVLMATKILMAPVKGGNDNDIGALRMVSLSAFRFRNHNQASVSPVAHRAHAEDHVVFGFHQVHFGFRRTQDVLRRKCRIAGGSPEDFVGGGARSGFPLDLGIVLEFLSQQADLSWRRGRQGQRRQRRRVETGHVGHVVVIHKLGQITKFDAVFRAWVLVLVVKIFAVLGKADRGKALVVERGMVAAAQVAVAAEDQQRAELAEVV